MTVVLALLPIMALAGVWRLSMNRRAERIARQETTDAWMAFIREEIDYSRIPNR